MPEKLPPSAAVTMVLANSSSLPAIPPDSIASICAKYAATRARASGATGGVMAAGADAPGSDAIEFDGAGVTTGALVPTASAAAGAGASGGASLTAGAAGVSALAGASTARVGALSRPIKN